MEYKNRQFNLDTRSGRIMLFIYDLFFYGYKTAIYNQKKIKIWLGNR
jgi:hypothetical protein